MYCRYREYMYILYLIILIGYIAILVLKEIITNYKRNPEVSFVKDISLIEKALCKVSPNDPMYVEMLMMAGEAYKNGLYNAAKDQKKAFEYFKKAATLSNPKACFYVGLQYFIDGDYEDDEVGGVNVALSLMYLAKASILGYEPATEQIKKMVESGIVPVEMADEVIADVKNGKVRI